MKAIVQSQFGSPEVLAFSDVAEPKVHDDQVLVRVHAASVNPWDWHFMRGLPYISRVQAGWRRPKNPVLGSDVAGEVVAVGAGVTDVRVGDEVMGFVGHGAFAEAASIPHDHLGPKPASLSYEQAAALPLAAMTALQGLRDVGNIRPGERVLIIGASGGVGTFAVQIAKWLGAHVTGVASTRNVELVRSLGADDVIDYTQQNFTDGSTRYDVIFQLAGTASPSELRRALTRRGRLVLSSGESKGRLVGPVGRMIKAQLLSPLVSHTLRPLTFKRSREDLALLASLVESGAVSPVIDRTYKLAETAEAVRYLETGRARGKVVISIEQA